MDFDTLYDLEDHITSMNEQLRISGHVKDAKPEHRTWLLDATWRAIRHINDALEAVEIQNDGMWDAIALCRAELSDAVSDFLGQHVRDLAEAMWFWRALGKTDSNGPQAKEKIVDGQTVEGNAVDAPEPHEDLGHTAEVQKRNVCALGPERQDRASAGVSALDKGAEVGIEKAEALLEAKEGVVDSPEVAKTVDGGQDAELEEGEWEEDLYDRKDLPNYEDSDSSTEAEHSPSEIERNESSHPPAAVASGIHARVSVCTPIRTHQDDGVPVNTTRDGCTFDSSGYDSAQSPEGPITKVQVPDMAQEIAVELQRIADVDMIFALTDAFVAFEHSLVPLSAALQRAVHLEAWGDSLPVFLYVLPEDEQSVRLFHFVEEAADDFGIGACSVQLEYRRPMREIIRYVEGKQHWALKNVDWHGGRPELLATTDDHPAGAYYLKLELDDLAGTTPPGTMDPELLIMAGCRDVTREGRLCSEHAGDCQKKADECAKNGEPFYCAQRCETYEVVKTFHVYHRTAIMLWAREMEEVVWQELGARKVELADNPEPTKGTVDDEGQGASTSTTGSPKKLGDIDVSLRTAS